MFNPKISGVAAGAGFVLSFLLGIVTGAAFPLVLIRALIFAVVFFALSGAGYWAIGMYLPELLDTVLDKGEVPTLGAQVDISVGDTGSTDAAGTSTEGSPPDISLNEFMENPGESGGDALDQNGEDGYTDRGDLEETPFDLGNPDPLDGLPDLDFMSGAFGSEEPALTGSPGAGGLASTGSLFDIEGKDGRGSLEKRGLAGEFAGKNVQEMASAIQTILKREDKG
jgi:hypothetical protein